MPSYEEIGGANAVAPDKQIQSGMAAIGLNGSWMISTFTKLTDADGKKLEIGLAPTPIGPSGKRASMFNGLADSVTTMSKQPENAAKWVKFLSGEQCQNIIGRSGVVFPARPGGTELAIDYNQNERKLDVTPFTHQVDGQDHVPVPGDLQRGRHHRADGTPASTRSTSAPSPSTRSPS